MPKLTTAQILDRVSLHALAVHAWHAEHGPDIADASIEAMRLERSGRLTAAEAALYMKRKIDLLPPLQALKDAALLWGPVEIAEAQLAIARGEFVTEDDRALQVILKYKAERDHGGLDVAEYRRRCGHYVRLRREARAKVHAARDRLEAAKVEAALDRIERHWPTPTDPAHPFVNLGAALAAE